jgi:cytidylate kinase
MIVSFNGEQGSGKSTIAERVARSLGYPRYYMGQLFRNMAAERGLNLEEFHRLCGKNPEMDKQVDNYLVDLAKDDRHFIIESRTAWHFIPESLKIYLKVDEKAAAKRIFNELLHGGRKNEDDGLDSEKSVLKSLQDRRKRDDERYRRYYGINIRDEKNYDFILDTTNLTADQVFKKTLEFIKSKINE